MLGGEGKDPEAGGRGPVKEWKVASVPNVARTR